MSGALFRNWRHPFYVLAHRGKRELTAKRDRDRHRYNLITSGSAVVYEDGLLIDPLLIRQEYLAGDNIYEEDISKLAKDEEKIFAQLSLVEAGTLISALIGMALLICLAWINF